MNLIINCEDANFETTPKEDNILYQLKVKNIKFYLLNIYIFFSKK
jgi:hypothetical protein